MNPALRAAADRLLRPGSRTRWALGVVLDRLVVPLSAGPPPGLRAGTVAAPGDRPTALVVLLGADPGTTAVLARQVARAQVMTGAFTPVFVVDRPVLSVLRRAGYAVELLPADDPVGLPGRLLELRRTYATDTVVVVPADAGALDGAWLGLLAGAVQPLHHGLPVPPRVRRALRAFEQWYDRGAAG